MFKGYWVLFYTIEKLVNAIGYNTYLAVNFKKKTSPALNSSSLLIYSLIDYNIEYINIPNVIETFIRISFIIILCKFNYEIKFKDMLKSIAIYWIIIYQSIRIFSETVLIKLTLSYTDINGIQIYTGETYISGEIHTLQILIFKSMLISLVMLLYKQYKDKTEVDKSHIKFMVIPIATNLICLLLFFRNTALEKNNDALNYLNSVMIPLLIFI